MKQADLPFVQTVKWSSNRRFICASRRIKFIAGRRDENTFGKRKKRYADIEAIFEELDE